MELIEILNLVVKIVKAVLSVLTAPLSAAGTALFGPRR